MMSVPSLVVELFVQDPPVMGCAARVAAKSLKSTSPLTLPLASTPKDPPIVTGPLLSNPVKKKSYKPNRTHEDEVNGVMLSVRAFEGLVIGVGIVATMAPPPGLAIRPAPIWIVTWV